MATGEKKRVLIVDDDDVLRRALVRCFSSAEVDVIDLADGRQALDYIAASRPHLILCDLRLPGADGWSVLNWLREHPPPTPFILITAHGSDQIADRALRAGAAAVFEKPLEMAHLKSCCGHWLSTTESAK